MNLLTDFYQQALFIWEKRGWPDVRFVWTFSLSLFSGFRTLAKNEDSYSQRVAIDPKGKMGWFSGRRAS